MIFSYAKQYLIYTKLPVNYISVYFSSVNNPKKSSALHKCTRSNLLLVELTTCNSRRECSSQGGTKKLFLRVSIQNNDFSDIEKKINLNILVCWIPIYSHIHIPWMFMYSQYHIKIQMDNKTLRIPMPFIKPLNLKSRKNK